MASPQLDWDGGTLVVRLDRMDAAVDRVVAGVMVDHASRAVAYARQNATWTDRTGNARAGLFARVDRAGRGKYALVLGHSVPYGVWLETRFSGRYAIIRPTVDHEGPAVMRTLAGVLDRI